MPTLAAFVAISDTLSAPGRSGLAPVKDKRGRSPQSILLLFSTKYVRNLVRSGPTGVSHLWNSRAFTQTDCLSYVDLDYERGWAANTAQYGRIVWNRWWGATYGTGNRMRCVCGENLERLQQKPIEPLRWEEKYDQNLIGL